MYGANRLALGILFIWLAGFLFFIAFHPGGLQVYDPNKKVLDPSTGEMKLEPGDRSVKNPVEIIRYFMSHHL